MLAARHTQLIKTGRTPPYTVAPAQAGPHHVCRSKTKGAMAPASAGATGFCLEKRGLLKLERPFRLSPPLAKPKTLVGRFRPLRSAYPKQKGGTFLHRLFNVD